MIERKIEIEKSVNCKVKIPNQNKTLTSALTYCLPPPAPPRPALACPAPKMPRPVNFDPYPAPPRPVLYTFYTRA